MEWLTCIKSVINYIEENIKEKLSIDDNIKVLERPNKSVKAPEMSHTENRIYAILQKGELKHIAFYDDKH